MKSTHSNGSRFGFPMKCMAEYILDILIPISGKLDRNRIYLKVQNTIFCTCLLQPTQWYQQSWDSLPQSICAATSCHCRPCHHWVSNDDLHVCYVWLQIFQHLDTRVGGMIHTCEKKGCHLIVIWGLYKPFWGRLKPNKPECWSTAILGCVEPGMLGAWKCPDQHFKPARHA